MSQVLTCPVATFSLPEDGELAESAFVGILNNTHETYLEMYGDTLPELFAAIEKADASGVAIHVLLDHTQSAGPTEHALLLAMIPRLNNTDITITTAGPDAQKSSQIAHRKKIYDVSGNVAFGSVNASHDGFFSQTNDLVSFNDLEYVAYAINKFQIRRDWARKHLPTAQLMPAVTVALPT